MSEATDKQTSSTGQPVEDTQEAQKGGILPEGWGEEDKPDPNDAYLGKYGNAAGDKISSTLGVVGQPMGKGLGTVARPVGGLVEPIVGGLMKSGKGFNDTFKEEYGKPSSAEVKEEMAKGEGGEEQTGENPLGLKSSESAK